jgi:hypothetical protein
LLLIHYKRKEEDVDPQCKTAGIIINRREVEMSAEARQKIGYELVDEKQAKDMHFKGNCFLSFQIQPL